MIPHTTILEILATTMLVYDYGKKFSVDEDETIETFLNNVDENFMNSLSSERREVLTNMTNYAPKGKVMMFVDDPLSDLQVGITKSDTQKRFMVVFRGTESRTDWFHDFMICKHNISGMIGTTSMPENSVHSGFHRQLFQNNNFYKIKDKLMSLLQQEEYADYDVYCTGHSLGGALCTLFGYFLSKKIDKHVVVVSFASPRVGNWSFKQDFDSQANLTHYRVTNNRDVVTATPMVGYKHTGVNVHLTARDVEICAAYDYNTYWKFSLWRCWSVSDHSIDLYYRRMKNCTWESEQKHDNNDDSNNNDNTHNNDNDNDVVDFHGVEIHMTDEENVSEQVVNDVIQDAVKSIEENTEKSE